MKISTILSKAGQILVFIIVFSILAGTLVSMISHYGTSYNLFQAEKSNVEVVAKTAEKGLFQPPAHYVKVAINDDHPDDVYAGVLNRVTTAQMKKLEQENEITGFIINDSHFFTLYDVITDSIVAISMIAFVSILLIGLLWWGVTIFIPKKKEKKQSRYKQNKARKRERKNKGKNRKAKEKERSFSFSAAFLVVFFLVAGVFSCLFLINGFHKFVPINQTKADAVVLNKYSEWEYLADGRRPIDPLFELTLLFTDAGGTERRVVKEVTRNTYYNYSLDETIPIAYRNGNPFDIFIKETTLRDWIEAVLYGKFFIYAIVAVAGVIAGRYVLRNLYRKLINRKADR